MDKPKKQNGKAGIFYKIKNFLTSDKFFLFILALFTIQTSWLAISAAYPMIYDEYFHVGVVDLYSEQFSPIFTSQPESASIYGDITRTPSYLYHYILSFFDRVITLFTDSFMARVVSLRLINVAFVLAGLVLFRRLFLKLGFSKAITNTSMLLVSLVPVFVHTSAHVNYDNLLFLVTPLFLIYAIGIISPKTNKFKATSLYLSVGLFALLVKYTFLPIFLIVSFLIAICTFVRKANLPKQILKDLQKYSVVKIVCLLALLMLASGLFVERQVMNVVNYGDVQPACDILHDRDVCAQNHVWAREYAAKQQKNSSGFQGDNLVSYTKDRWLPAMVEGSLVAVANTGSKEEVGRTVKSTEFYSPMPILLLVFWAALVTLILVLAWTFPRLKKINYFWLMFGTVSFYGLAVLLYNYTSYLKVGASFAMQPRYFLIVLPIIFVYYTQALSYIVKNLKVKIFLLALVVLTFSQGGGAMTYIARSNEGWYWNREKIINSNERIKSLITPVIKEGTPNKTRAQ